MTKTPVRVRFAPSPTGFLHIGGVRTALFNWLLAKQTGGTFILRLEDTDRERFVEAGIEQITTVLDWFGLQPDEGFWEGQETGEVGPYVQSKRLPNYRKYVDQLLAAGLAYASHIAPDDYAQARTAAQKAGQAFVYRRSLEPAESLDVSAPIRLDIAACAEQLGVSSVKWLDNRGDSQIEATIAVDTIEDFVILKTDGFPTYNFANIIDDHLMGISHILRGDEFISSTPKHALLYDILQFPRPTWLHLPVILGADGAKLSKRHGDTDALQYRDKGYLPEAMLNFLALLGWNDGTEQEIFSRTELIEKFSLERVQKSPAKFDLERLNWMNGVWIREKLTQDQYLERAHRVLNEAGVITATTPTELVKQSALLERDRIKFFAELPEAIAFFFTPPQPTADFLSQKLGVDKARQLLEVALMAIKQFPEDEAGIEAVLRDTVAEQELKAGEFFSVIRTAITGRTAAPGLFETITVLGIAETLERLKTARKVLG